MTIDAKCVTVDRSTRVKVEERGKKAVIYNKLSEKIYIIKVDGCVCQNETAADFVISKHGVGDVIVELKGKDVEHAAKQINATAEIWNSMSYRQGKLAGLIVSTQYPKASTMIQRAQIAFAKKYNGPLHVVAKNCEYVFIHLLSFRGPFGT